MRSATTAMAWEMWQRGRWKMAASFVGPICLTMLVFGALRYQGMEDLRDINLRGVHLCFMQLNLFMFATFVLDIQGPLNRMYLLPIPTSNLVAFRMLTAMLVVGSEAAASAAILNAILNLGWPLWGPALFAATTLAAIQAAIWYTEKTLWVIPAIAGVSGGLGIWFIERLPPQFKPAFYTWREVTSLDVFGLIAVAIAAYFVGVAGVSRNRCGEHLQPLGIKAWLDRFFDVAPVDGPAFRSRTEAQYWSEWRKKGWAMPGIVILGLVMGAGFWLFFSRNPKDLVSGLIGGGAVLSVIGFVGAIIMGNTGRTDSEFEMGSFLASRPIANTELTKITLRVIAKSVLLAWAIWLVAFSCVCGVVWLTGRNPLQDIPPGVRWWYLPATLLGCWTVTAVLTSICLMGRIGLFSKVILFLCALFFTFNCFSGFVLTRDAQKIFTQGLLIIVGIAFIFISCIFFFAGRKRQMIDSKDLVVCGCFWLAASTIVGIDGIQQPPEMIPNYIFSIGLLALAVVPPAAAPLALAWNRHR